ncbi:MAG: FkbM family methyltransferase, partial [Acetobacteraceae bacterium]|nr:FkbM family methyltransferase [Acetobacteraceae bacterium]
MPPDDTGPRSRPQAASSTRNAVRGGVLAALSGVAAPARDAPSASPAIGPAPSGGPAPPRGLGAALRAAGLRGLLAAKPLAMPFLHRFQMRVRTAVDESGVAARMAGVEEALATLSVRLDGHDALRREVAKVGEAVSGVARRLDAAPGDAAQRDEAVQRRLGEIAQQLEAAQRRLGEIGQQSEAAQRRLEAAQREVPDLLQARLPPRTPIRVGDEFLVRTPDGYLLLPTEDVRLLAAMYERGVLEPGTRAVLSALLPPGGTFLDVGAHVGTMTVMGAHRVGEGGRVFAVEPLPRLAALLRRSMALNDLAGRVSV